MPTPEETSQLQAARRQKAIDIASSIFSAAQSMIEPFKEPIPHGDLLRKKPFPNRRLPHRIKRARKKQARRAQALRIASAAMKGAMAAANVYRQMAQPVGILSAYQSGGVPIAPRSEITINRK